MATKKKQRSAKSRGGAGIDMRIIAATALVAASAGATWWLWVNPAVSASDSARAGIESAQQATLAAQSRIGALRAGESSNAEALLAQARALDAQLPSNVDKESLVAAIPTAAAANGLQVERMDPVPDAATAGEVTSLAFATEVSGDLGQVLTFLEDLTSSENNTALITIDGLALSTTESAATAAFTLTAFGVSSPTLPAGTAS